MGAVKAFSKLRFKGICAACGCHVMPNQGMFWPCETADGESGLEIVCFGTLARAREHRDLLIQMRRDRVTILRDREVINSLEFHGLIQVLGTTPTGFMCGLTDLFGWTFALHWHKKQAQNEAKILQRKREKELQLKRADEPIFFEFLEDSEHVETEEYDG